MISTKAIDRLFEKLSAIYGEEWTRKWGTAPLKDVKTIWADELASYGNAGGLECMLWALQNLPERAPNAIQFKALCRQAPRPEALPAPLPKADPERMKAEIAKLGPILNSSLPLVDSRDWARSILANPRGRTPTVIQMAKSALSES